MSFTLICQSTLYLYSKKVVLCLKSRGELVWRLAGWRRRIFGGKTVWILEYEFAPSSRQVREKRLLKCFTAPLSRLLRFPPTLFLRRPKKESPPPPPAAAAAEGVFTAFPLSRCVGTFPQKFSSRTGTLVGQVEYSYIHWQFFFEKKHAPFFAQSLGRQYFSKYWQGQNGYLFKKDA